MPELKPGDEVTRMLSGTIPMKMIVEKIENNIIYTKGGWTFDAEFGVEIDEDLGWGPDTGVTGSYLILKDSSHER